MLDQRGQLLWAAVGLATFSTPSYDRALWALRNWLDSSGIASPVGMAHHGYDLQPSPEIYRHPSLAAARLKRYSPSLGVTADGIKLHKTDGFTDNRRRAQPLRRIDGMTVVRAALTTATICAVILAIVLAESTHAQPAPKLPAIGILATGQLRTSPPYPALERTLRELGLVDGQNVRIEFRMAEGRIERLPTLAAELVHSNVDVIVAGGTFPSIEAARRAASVTPIVMIAVDYDPVATKVVSSLNRPGGNITGVFVRQIELTAKRMEFLKEIAPKAKRVAILSDPYTIDQLKMAESTAPNFGIRVQPLQFQAVPYDYAAAFNSAAKERAGAALVTVGPVFFRDRARLVEVALQQRIPTMFPLPEFADAGGLIAYGANLDQTFASAAPYIEKILKGVKPADLPIEQPKYFELVVNMKAAKTIGVTFPKPVLLRADRIIE